MPAAPPARCPRCINLAAWDEPPAWVGWLQRAWVGGLCLLLPLGPVMMSDVVFMLPALTVYMFGAGTALSTHHRESTCRHCGYAWLPPPSFLTAWWHRRKPPVPQPRPRLRLVPPLPASEDPPQRWTSRSGPRQ